MLEVRRGQRVVCLADAGRERDQNVAPRSMSGGRESYVCLTEKPAERERVTSGEMWLLSTLRWAWLRIASGYIFMIGESLRRYRMKPYVSYLLKSNTMDHSRCTYTLQFVCLFVCFISFV